VFRKRTLSALQRLRKPSAIFAGIGREKGSEVYSLRDDKTRAIALALNATLRDSEVKTLTWERINFLEDILTVGRSKTAAGAGRTIPINSELRAILEDYRAWYEEKIGPAKPENYVFPYGKSRQWDPTKPINSFKTAWENVREKAGIKARSDIRR
jgi:integrase